MDGSGKVWTDMRAIRGPTSIQPLCVCCAVVLRVHCPGICGTFGDEVPSGSPAPVGVVALLSLCCCSHFLEVLAPRPLCHLLCNTCGSRAGSSAAAARGIKTRSHWYRVTPVRVQVTNSNSTTLRPTASAAPHPCGEMTCMSGGKTSESHRE